jgi:hypothetical protein
MHNMRFSFTHHLVVHARPTLVERNYPADNNGQMQSAITYKSLNQHTYHLTLIYWCIV